MPSKLPLRIPRKLSSLPESNTKAPLPKIHVPPAPRVAPRARTAQPRTPTPAPPPCSPPSPRSKTIFPSWASNKYSWPRYFLYWGGWGFAGACGVLFVRDNVVSLDKVKGSSMAPTLNAKTHETGWRDRLLIRTAAGVRHDVKRGDIITFWKPHKAEEISIKRVVAVGGDTVFPRRGFFVDEGFMSQKRLGLMDGLSNDDEDWVRAGKEKGQEVGIKVPHGHIWVEGDNWRETLDSCSFGPIALGLVEGRASRVWSWSRLGFHEIGDKRLSKDSRKGASRVVEGKGSMPNELME